MQLWLVPSAAEDARVPPPHACPHAGCGGRRLRRLQAVAKPVRDARALAAHGGPSAGAVTAMRYACRTCGRSFRAYPRGVDRGNVAVGIKRFAAALHFLGLSYRDVSLALTVLGVPISSSRLHAVVAPRMRGLAHRSTAPLLARVAVVGGAGGGTGVDTDAGVAASVEVAGRRLTLRRAVDSHGRVALVIEGIDLGTRRAVEAWVRGVLAGFGVSVDVVFPAVRRGRPRRAPAAMDAAGGMECGERRETVEGDGDGDVAGGDVGGGGRRGGDGRGGGDRRGARGDGGIGGVDGGRVAPTSTAGACRLVRGSRMVPGERSPRRRHRRRHRRGDACRSSAGRCAFGAHGAGGRARIRRPVAHRRRARGRQPGHD